MSGYLSPSLCFLESLTFAQLREETAVNYEYRSVPSSWVGRIMQNEDRSKARQALSTSDFFFRLCNSNWICVAFLGSRKLSLSLVHEKWGNISLPAVQLCVTLAAAVFLKSRCWNQAKELRNNSENQLICIWASAESCSSNSPYQLGTDLCSLLLLLFSPMLTQQGV